MLPCLFSTSRHDAVSICVRASACLRVRTVCAVLIVISRRCVFPPDQTGVRKGKLPVVQGITAVATVVQSTPSYFFSYLTPGGDTERRKFGRSPNDGARSPYSQNLLKPQETIRLVSFSSTMPRACRTTVDRKSLSRFLYLKEYICPFSETVMRNGRASRRARTSVKWRAPSRFNSSNILDMGQKSGCRKLRQTRQRKIVHQHTSRTKDVACERATKQRMVG